MQLQKNINKMKIKLLINKFRLHLAMVLLVLGIFLPSKMPYVNLFAEQINSFVIWIVAVIVVGLKWRYLFILSIGLFLIISVLSFVNENIIAESLGNSTFLIILSATILMFLEELKNKE